MAIITLPTTTGFRNASFGLDGADSLLEYFDGGVQVTAYAKALWSFSFALPKTARANLSAWYGAIVQLSSLANVFQAGPPGYTGPSSSYAGATPLVNGGSQIGATINVDGATPSTLLFRAGDFFSFSAGGYSELKMVTADITTTVSGSATVAFWPPIRIAPANNAALQITSPITQFGFREPAARIDIDLMLNGDLSIAAVERFNP